VSPTNYQLTQKIYNIGMKHIKYRIIPLLLLISFLPLSKVNATSLDAEIAKIKSAPPHLRVKLMNQLKMKIWKMRQAQRLRAIKRLRRSIPTSKKVVIHTIKYNRDIKRNGYISDNRIAPINSLKHRVDIINHHNITKIAHDLVETHKDILKNRYNTQIENHIDNKIPITTDKHISQNQKNPITIQPNSSTTKETQNTPLNVLDTKASNELSNKIVETNQNQQTIVIDNSIKTEQSNQVTMTNNQQEQTINTTQSSNINLNNSIKTEQSNQVTMTNNQQEQTINTTQSSNINLNNSIKTEQSNQVTMTNNQQEQTIQVTQPNTNSHTIKVDNSAQTDIKVINAESKPIIHQDNTVKESNIEVNQEVHIEEHRHISNSSSQSSSNVVSTPIQHSLTPTSQRTTKRLDVRSLRIYIQNRSRRR